ncbi:MAG: tetratricopeptide repeat protein [Candidatus Omnitrophota bacterium]
MSKENLLPLELDTTIENSINRLEKPTSGFDLEDSLASIKAQEISPLTKKFISFEWNEIKKEILLFPKSPRLLLELGEIHLAKKDYLRARRIFTDIIKIEKNYLLAYERLIFVNLILNEFDEVEKIYKNYIEISNERIEVLHNYVIFRLFFKGFKDQDNVKLCLSILEKVIQKDKNNFRGLNTYGFILLNVGNLEEARQYFDRSLKIKEDFIHANNNLGVYFLRKGNLKAANEYFEKALQKNINFIPAHENKLQILIIDKKFKEAKEYINKIKSPLFLSAKWKINLAIVLTTQRKFKEAIDLYLEYLENNAENPYILNNLGFCFMVDGDIRKAESYLNRSYLLSKRLWQLIKNPLALYNVGRIALIKKNLVKLRETADEILYYFPDDQFGVYLIAASFTVERKYKEAKDLLYKIIEKQSNISEAYSDLGFILSSIDRNYNEAVRVMNIALERKIASALTINNMAYSLAKMDKLKEAEQLLAIIKQPSLPVYFATKGLIAIRGGFLQRGIMLYYKTIRSLSDEYSKTVAKQLLSLEKANYYIKRNEISKAKYSLNYAVKLGNTYVNDEIEEFIKNKLNT